MGLLLLLAVEATPPLSTYQTFVTLSCIVLLFAVLAAAFAFLKRHILFVATGMSEEQINSTTAHATAAERQQARSFLQQYGKVKLVCPSL